jgi:hypothetical protein
MPRVPKSFYEPDGDVYVATELTRGPWDPGAQHAGPPAALIGREIERLGGGRMADRPGRSDLAGGQARGNRLRDAQLFGGSGAKHPFE